MLSLGISEPTEDKWNYEVSVGNKEKLRGFESFY